ncbi:MAG: flagellar motor switch protein FliM [Bryobacterales bacterium]|nr:flagellar motor switch protein FliM [Bryobacterales bacterium]
MELVSSEGYDFRRPDRIAKEQLRAIHVLHDNFARSLASSLSAYLRAYVMVNLVSVEQLSYVEFSKSLPSPTCVVSLGMKPFDESAVLEINPSLVFPILEVLLGGTGKGAVPADREITEIEWGILDGLFRIVLHDLKEAWHAVSSIEFTIEARETEPQLLQILSPNEATVSIGVEIQIGETTGRLNLGVPSIVIKMLRQKFDHQWSVRRSQSGEQEQARLLNLLRPVPLRLDARLEGPTIDVEQLLKLERGDILTFDHSVDEKLRLLANGMEKYLGHVVAQGRKRAFLIESLV